MRCVKNGYKVHWVTFCPHGTIKPPIWFSFNCTSILHRMDSNSPLAPHKTSISSPLFVARKKTFQPQKKPPRHTSVQKCFFKKFFRLPTIFFSQLTAFCTLGTTKATNSSLGGGQYRGVHRKTTKKQRWENFTQKLPNKEPQTAGLDLENDLMSSESIFQLGFLEMCEEHLQVPFYSKLIFAQMDLLGCNKCNMLKKIIGSTSLSRSQTSSYAQKNIHFLAIFTKTKWSLRRLAFLVPQLSPRSYSKGTQAGRTEITITWTTNLPPGGDAEISSLKMDSLLR